MKSLCQLYHRRTENETHWNILIGRRLQIFFHTLVTEELVDGEILSMATLTTIGRSAPTVIRSASRRNNDLHRCYSILLQPARTRIGSNVFPRNSTAPINFRRRLLSGTKDSNRNPQTVVEESSSASAGKVSTSSSNTSSFKSFWIWYLGPKEMPERWTLPWYREMVLICTVFAITGSSTMVLVSTCLVFLLKCFLSLDPLTPSIRMNATLSLTVSPLARKFRYGQQFQTA